MTLQGMSFLVASFLLYMGESESFCCLVRLPSLSTLYHQSIIHVQANLLQRRIHSDFFRLQRPLIEAYVLCFDHYFRKFLPLLYDHMVIITVLYFSLLLLFDHRCKVCYSNT